VPSVIEVVAEPNRRRILDRLRQAEASVGTLVEEIGSSQPLISKHLRVLRDAGLVDVRVDGQRRLYRVRAEGLIELDDWLAPYRQMWETSLDRLEAHMTSRGETND